MVIAVEEDPDWERTTGQPRPKTIGEQFLELQAKFESLENDFMDLYSLCLRLRKRVEELEDKG